MTLHKKILAAAIVSGLFATTAQAQVVISGTPTPVLYAQEIVSTSAAPVTLAAINENQIQSALLYNFSAGEVRHARVECSPHVRISAGSAVVSSTANLTIGAINGLGTNVISFSMTAGSTPPVAADTITINGARSITSTAAGTCAYSLYDQPSQAANGGSTGLIVTTGQKSYLAVGPSFRLAVSSPRTSTANVETLAPNPAFGDFIVDAPTTVSTAALASVLFDVQPTTSQPRLAGGALVATNTELDDILAPTSVIRVNATNDGFSAAASAGNTYDAAAQARVYLTAANAASCASEIGSSAPMTATQASFPSGDLATAGAGHVALATTPRLLCMARLAGNTIPVTDFTVQYNAVGQTGFAPTSIGAVAAGNIVRNGTQLQAPLAQVPGGYLSRMVLTNTGGLARPYTISVMGETGNVIGTANLTGTVPANGTTVVNLNNVLTSFTGNTRATLNVTVAGPNSQIQGLYQIVNPAYGSISNHVMVRPGSN